MGDAGEIAKAVDHAMTIGEKIVEEVNDAREDQAVADWKQQWNIAVANGDAEAMDRLLAQLPDAGLFGLSNARKPQGENSPNA